MELEPIATDRPDQTESPYLVPVGYFQIETGFQLEADKRDGQSEKNLTYHSSLLKYGISKNLELRFITEYLGYQRENETDRVTASMNGFSPVSVGGKLFICEQKGFLPKTSLIAHIDLPYLGRQEFRPSFIAPRFRFTMQHSLSSRVNLSYNLGGEWDGESPNATGIYTLTTGISLIKNLGVYLELYGFLRERSAPDHRFNGGFTYLLNNNLQLDTSVGVGINEASPDSFVSTGFSWRFDTRTHARQRRPAKWQIPSANRPAF